MHSNLQKLILVLFCFFSCVLVDTYVSQIVDKEQLDRIINNSSGGDRDEDWWIGKWTYRSFVSVPSLPEQPVPIQELLFGRGTMEFEPSNDGTVVGTLGGPGWQLEKRKMLQPIY